MHAIVWLEPPLEELEAGLPHLDGKPLEDEPCVPALRSLLDQLEQLKASAAADVERARAAHAEARESSVLGAALLASKAGPQSTDGAAAVAKEPFLRVLSEYEEKQRRRRQLLEEVFVPTPRAIGYPEPSSTTCRRAFMLACDPSHYSHLILGACTTRALRRSSASRGVVH